MSLSLLKQPTVHGRICSTLTRTCNMYFGLHVRYQTVRVERTMFLYLLHSLHVNKQMELAESVAQTYKAATGTRCHTSPIRWPFTGNTTKRVFCGDKLVSLLCDCRHYFSTRMTVQRALMPTHKPPLEFYA